MNRQSASYRAGILLLSVVFLLVSGFFAWKLLSDGKKKPAQFLAEAEAAYDRGLKAYEANEARSVAFFEESLVTATNGLVELDRLAKAGKDDPELRGRLSWVNVKAARDRAYAKAMAEGKPIAPPIDSTTREPYRILLAIRDVNERANILAASREAAKLLPRDPEVLLNALRTELATPVTAWPVVEELCRNVVAIKPKDPRARFFLAYIDFEQFDDKGLPRPEASRDPARVAGARDHLAASKAEGKAPPWRTLGLECQIADWRIRHGSANEGLAELKAVLTDSKTGLISVSKSKSSLDALSRYDVAGISNAHRIAMTHKILEPDAILVNDFQLVARLVDSQQAAVAPLMQDALNAAKASPVPLSAAVLDALETTFQLLQSKQLLVLSHSQSALPLLAADPKRQPQTIAALNAGLKLAAKPEDKDSFHLLGLKLKEAGPFEAMREHLEALKNSASPKHQAIAAEREAEHAMAIGKLDFARRWYEEVARRPEADELAVRAYIILPDLLLALNRTSEASAYSNELRKMYERSQSGTPEFKAWVVKRLASVDDANASCASANFLAARQKIERERKEKGDRPLPADFTKTYEDYARTALEQLKPGTAADRIARIARHEFLLLARPEIARGEFEPLAKQYPNEPSIWRAEYHDVPVEARKADDAKNRQRAMTPGRELYWAEWLFSTNRMTEGLASLATLTTPEATRLTAYLKGQPNPDPAIAAILTRAFQPDPGQLHHMISGAATLRQGVEATLAGDPAAAARHFRKLNEHVHYQSAAKAGYRRAIDELTKRDPTSAERLAKE
jgi:hypothetical protein